jgi:hypothetical protein
MTNSFVLCHPLHKLEEEERVFFMVSHEEKTVSGENEAVVQGTSGKVDIDVSIYV